MFRVQQRQLAALPVLLVLVMAGCSAPSTESAQPPISVAELKRQTETPAYDDLARTPEQYKGHSLKFTGEVVQVTGDPNRPVLRINITKGDYDLWQNTVWVNVKTDVRVLEKDIVQFWAVGQGDMTYKAVMGNEIRIPQVDAYALDVVTKAGDRK